jgi:hypothetical protein
MLLQHPAVAYLFLVRRFCHSVVKRSVIIFVLLALAGCAAPSQEVTFRRQFDHFYPDDPNYVTKMYRAGYLKLMSDPTRSGDLGRASTGDSAALRRFLLRASTERNKLDGERSETYSYDLCFLLIKLGDQRFSAALRDLTPVQREATAHYLDLLISEKRDWFPLTTACYVYRYRRNA